MEPNETVLLIILVTSFTNKYNQTDAKTQNILIEKIDAGGKIIANFVDFLEYHLFLTLQLLTFANVGSLQRLPVT